MKNLIAFFVFAIVSLVIGLGSARSMIDGGFSLIVREGGPWKAWLNAGSQFADPYTKAHFARSGELPITSASGLTFSATTDDNGRRLTSDCEYEIIAHPLTALWWSIAVFDQNGKIIPNAAGRHAFSSQNLTILLDGTQRISLAPTARPGHWLPSGEDHYLTLQLRIIRPLTIEQQQNSDSIGAQNLPRIQRVKC